MRTIILVAALFIVGCTSSPTLEELEDEALRTGNWEAVEEHEAMRARRNGAASEACPGGKTKYCIENGSKVDCNCASLGGRL